MNHRRGIARRATGRRLVRRGDLLHAGRHGPSKARRRSILEGLLAARVFTCGATRPKSSLSALLKSVVLLQEMIGLTIELTNKKVSVTKKAPNLASIGKVCPCGHRVVQYYKSVRQQDIANDHRRGSSRFVFFKTVPCPRLLRPGEPE